ncbi:alginate biosynthesis protein AlgX, partial [Pseudomonas syringae pv. japonica str. M301072]
APTFKAEPCCSLCPAAHDAKNYTTRYQQNFTTLVQAQGDWLFQYAFQQRASDIHIE